MIRVLFQSESHYPIRKKFIEETIQAELKGKVKRNTEVSVSIIGDRMMKQLNAKYRQINETTDVLSFPQNDPTQKTEPFINPPDDVLRLGDIVISYPQAMLGAAEETKLIDDKIRELVLHGLNHLLGIHHEI